jgi:hypothetical protein
VTESPEIALEVALEPRPVDPRSGVVVVSNVSQRAVRIWRTGNSWGDGALSFVLARADREDAITKRPQRYTRNVAAALELDPQDSERFAFDLLDGSWEPQAALAGLDEPSARLAALLEIEPTPEAAEQDVWTGRIRSDFVDLG